MVSAEPLFSNARHGAITRVLRQCPGTHFSTNPTRPHQRCPTPRLPGSPRPPGRCAASLPTSSPAAAWRPCSRPNPSRSLHRKLRAADQAPGSVVRFCLALASIGARPGAERSTVAWLNGQVPAPVDRVPGSIRSPGGRCHPSPPAGARHSRSRPRHTRCRATTHRAGSATPGWTSVRTPQW